jgi:hypothetical protein
MSFRAYDLAKLVDDFGETLTLRKRTTAGTYNPATGSLSNMATTDYSFVGYFYNYNVGFTPTLDQIEKGTRKCLIPAPNIIVAPDTDDQILRGSDKVNIIHVVTAYSNGVALHYICDVVS